MEPTTLLALLLGGAGIADAYQGGSSLKKPFGNWTNPLAPKKPNQLSMQTPGQSQLLDALISQLQQAPQSLGNNPLYQQGSDVLSRLLSGERDEALEAPLMTQFQQEIIPQIKARFHGSQASGGLNNSLAQAAKGLLESFGAMRSSNRNSALQQVLGYAQAPGNEYYNKANLALSQRPFQYQEQPMGFLKSLIGSGAGGFGQQLGRGFARTLTGPAAGV